jgi:hypothetical protein
VSFFASTENKSPLFQCRTANKEILQSFGGIITGSYGFLDFVASNRDRKNSYKNTKNAIAFSRIPTTN